MSLKNLISSRLAWKRTMVVLLVASRGRDPRSGLALARGAMLIGGIAGTLMRIFLHLSPSDLSSLLAADGRRSGG
jgi:hypothetical protein